MNEDIKFFEIGQCLTLPLGHCLFKLHVEPARFGVTLKSCDDHVILAVLRGLAFCFSIAQIVDSCKFSKSHRIENTEQGIVGLFLFFC